MRQRVEVEAPSWALALSRCEALRSHFESKSPNALTPQEERLSPEWEGTDPRSHSTLTIPLLSWAPTLPFPSCGGRRIKRAPAPSSPFSAGLPPPKKAMCPL